MHVIVSTQGGRRWLSGVFCAARDAEAACSSLPTGPRVVHAVHWISPREFPFFVLETRSGFMFLDLIEASRVIARTQAPGPDADAILFAILSEYQPEVPGRDEMGRLRHVHLDEDHLARLRTLGPLSLTT
jgi:hypothetical protein